MTDLILHHYPTSPFSEKVRLVLGYKQLAWKSVIIPATSPKPDVVALTGGYRKTPVLQIGADVYCDSALICEVLEHLQPTPTLYPESDKGLSRIVAQWADSPLFWAAMTYNLQPQGAAAIFAGVPAEAVKTFAADRAAMANGMTRLRPGDATAAYKSYLRRMATMLEGQDFLLGSAPCVADFAAYHPLWFTAHRVPVMAGILDATPSVQAWMARMAAIGHGNAETLSATEAIALCAHTAGAKAPLDTYFQDEHGIPLGSEVTIAAEAFGQETTAGTLLAASRTRFTLKRVDERAGTVHVHFPRIGYVLKGAQA
nr:glutathione S-transferase family protein [uncultured Rhodoferax sp.]